MTTTLVAEPEAVEWLTEDGDFAICHLYCCCDENISFCGRDISGDMETDQDDTHDCVVCADLLGLACPRCGYSGTGPCLCGKCP